MDISLKRAVLEPKIYALMVESARGQVLHLGVHFSLEEAYAAARQKMDVLAPPMQGEAIDIDLWNSMSARQVIAQLMDPAKANELIQSTLPEGTSKEPVDHAIIGPTFVVGNASGGIDKLPEMLKKLLEKPEAVRPLVKTTIGEQVKDIKSKRNELMKRLIRDGDTARVEELKSVLGANSYRYVLKAIEKRSNKS
jgi:hypothetical protein